MSKKPKLLGNVEPRIEKILAAAEKEIEKLADEYRKDILLPLCRKLNLTYLPGNGELRFFPPGKHGYDDTIRSSHDADQGYPELVAVFKDLDVEFGRNDVFGYYILRIDAKDLA